MWFQLVRGFLGTESLLVSKRGASSAVAVRIRPGQRSPEYMATTSHGNREPSFFQVSLSLRDPEDGVA